jgi:uncharacterized protein YbjT (DUF2867 family)
MHATPLHDAPILVLGATGRTGSRVVDRLIARDHPVRVGSRSADPPFEWADPATWGPVLDGVRAVYIAFFPDLAVPGAAETIAAFVARARDAGVRRLVLLSGRGEDEAVRSERIVQASGLEWTVLRASWFAQNFSEGLFRDAVLSGVLALPAGAVREPFIDVDDIADVAVAALTEPGHDGELYELTGPRLMSFGDVAAEIGAASGHAVRYESIPAAAFAAGLAAEGVPTDMIELLEYLMHEVLDGRNAHLADGVARALGRPPRDFTAFARAAAAAGAWDRERASAGSPGVSP